MSIKKTKCCLCGVADHVYWDTAFGLKWVKCRICGLIYCEKMNVDLSVKNDSIYNQEYFLGGKFKLPKIQGAQLKSCQMERDTLEEFKKGGRILDVGCGMGKFFRVLGNNWDKYGCDVSEAAVKYVQEGNLFNVKQGLLEELDYPEKSFDVVYFRASLHHTFNPLATLKHAAGLIKDDGVLVVAVSNNADGPCGRVFKGRTRSLDDGHTHFFTTKTLTMLLDEAGFKVAYKYYPYWGTGYERWTDFIDFVLQALRLYYRKIFGKSTDAIQSPPFYANFVSIYARPKR